MLLLPADRLLPLVSFEILQFYDAVDIFPKNNFDFRCLLQMLIHATHLLVGLTAYVVLAMVTQFALASLD